MPGNVTPPVCFVHPLLTDACLELTLCPYTMNGADMNETAIERHLQQLQEVADRLRQTAEEIRTGAIHPCHAANRVKKLANQLAQEKK
jgi:hypothetical protein